MKWSPINVREYRTFREASSIAQEYSAAKHCTARVVRARHETWVVEAWVDKSIVLLDAEILSADRNAKLEYERLERESEYRAIEINYSIPDEYRLGIAREMVNPSREYDEDT